MLKAQRITPWVAGHQYHLFPTKFPIVNTSSLCAFTYISVAITEKHLSAENSPCSFVKKFSFYEKKMDEDTVLYCDGRTRCVRFQRSSNVSVESYFTGSIPYRGDNFVAGRGYIIVVQAIVRWL